MTLMTIIIVVLIIQWIVVIWNRHALLKTRDNDSKTDTSAIKLSILVPARDEEANMEALITSIYQQTVLPDEVIILDDHSSDRTPEILIELKQKYSTLKVLQGKRLPEDWSGKSYACHQLAKEAKGDWFVFLDADARLYPNALKELTAFLTSQKTGIVSGFPKQVVKTLSEALVVPLMMTFIMMHLPIHYVTKSQNPKFSAAHGGFIAIKRMSYHKAGGHQAIRSSIVDDMALFTRQKAFGFPATLMKVDDWVCMRMYDSFKGVYSGFQKNIFAGVGRRVPLLLFVMLYYIGLFVLPFFLIPVVPISLVVVSYALGVGIKWTIDRTNRIPAWVSLLMPFSVLLFVLIGTSSMVRSVTKKGYQWKGRHYQ